MSAYHHSYARALRRLAEHVRIEGPSGLAKLAGVSRRTAKAHWLGERLPGLDAHRAYAQAVIAARRHDLDPGDIIGPELFAQALTNLETSWDFGNNSMLESSFVERDERAKAMPWPDFLTAYEAGVLDNYRMLSVAIDFSGYRSVEIGWILLLRPANKVRREAFVVARYKGRTVLLQRLQHAPNPRAREVWRIWPNEMLWRDPHKRQIMPRIGALEMDIDALKRRDPELEVFVPEIVRRQDPALEIIYVCDPSRLPT